ncbi:MAG: hypothetical protein P1U64_07320 [Alcanivoracaceae bacterium]|nr:hypothetical protein [Alcanivoracaceae bacterium]
MISNIRELAFSLGKTAEGSEWHLFGSVARNKDSAADIDLMIICESDIQADDLRSKIDCDSLSLPLDLMLLTFQEAADIDAIKLQSSEKIYPLDN